MELKETTTAPATTSFNKGCNAILYNLHLPFCVKQKFEMTQLLTIERRWDMTDSFFFF